VYGTTLNGDIPEAKHLFIVYTQQWEVFPKLVWIFVSTFVCSYLYLGVLTKIMYNIIICFGKDLI
jgi:hypothetical protein